MPGKVGISTLVYAKAFIDKAWGERASMLDYERKGFYQFLYVTACGYSESILCDYLKSIIFMARMNIVATNAISQRRTIEDGKEVLLNAEQEQMAVRRFLEKTMETLDKAPFERIEELHKDNHRREHT
jgi:hypothetical protein